MRCWRPLLAGLCLAALLGQLHSIAEGILREDSSAPLQLNGIDNYAIPTSLEILGERFQVVHSERWMRLLGGAEVFLHSKVQLLSATLEPDASAGGQRFGFRDLSQSKYVPVEGTCGSFLAARHCDLDVIES